MRGGLTRRVVIASALLTLVLAAGFMAVLLAIVNLRESTQSRRDIRQELVAANALETLVIDLETGVRGFVIAHDERFLAPWTDARAAFPGQSRALERLVADEPVQFARIRRIVQNVTSYVRDYALPLLATARRNDPSARTVAKTTEGSRRIDAIRSEFDAFLAAGNRTLTTHERRADNAGRLALAGAGAGAAGSILLIVLFAGYLSRVIVRPVRRAALMADRIAGGDLNVRMTESAIGEVGALERSFNVMADSLARERDELAGLAEEQAALRRVATLVARGTPADELFVAVTEEVGQLLNVVFATMGRLESDGTMTTLTSWSGAKGPFFTVGDRLSLGGNNVSTLVVQTGRPARIDSGPDASDPVAVESREQGVRSSVGTPIIVEGHLWGVMVAGTTHEKPLPSETEGRLAGFTELLATAIANAESRAELAASRARIVAAADETRRRIERDLHDGAQQRLVSLGLELRAAQTAVPQELGELGGELSRVTEGLARVQDELREMARGIHPAILAEGGLGPALKTLARRSPIPVEVDVRGEVRLPERVEVAAYYVVSESLTNAAKHAHASVVQVDVEAVDRILRLSVRDDGGGGADPNRGSGLIGLKDRVEALGGTITVQSPLGAGTSVYVELPLDVPATR